MTDPNNFNTLAKWVQPQLFDPRALASLKSLSQTELEAGIFIDDFLKEEHLGRLQLALREEAKFEAWYRLKNKDGSVTEQEYYASEEKKRFYHFSKLIGPKPEHLMSPTWLTFVKFQMDYSSGMAAFLGDIAHTPLATEANITHTLYRDSSLHIHNDHIDGRRICTVFYLSEAWEPQHGAELVMLRKEDGRNKEINRIAHKTNRLVIFSINKDTLHYVDAFADLAKDKQRRTVVYWFKDRA